MSNASELRRQISTVADHLLRTQRELGALLDRAANPLVESVDAARRRSLERQRDALLDRWSRLALCWVLEGGTVELAPAGQASVSA